jgi:hypothetical protein
LTDNIKPVVLWGWSHYVPWAEAHDDIEAAAMSAIAWGDDAAVSGVEDFTTGERRWLPFGYDTQDGRMVRHQNDFMTAIKKIEDEQDEQWRQADREAPPVIIAEVELPAEVKTELNSRGHVRLNLAYPKDAATAASIKNMRKESPAK